MLKNRLVQALLIVLVIIGITPAQVQPAQAAPFITPLVFVMKGDLWTWTMGSTSPTQLTHHGYNFRPILSPDGTRIAYKSVADIAVATASRKQGKNGLFANEPTNIWVWDLSTGQAVRVADQPGRISGDASTNSWRDALLRSNPTWSPDGNRLAWVEATLPELGYRLMIYDFAANTTRAIVPSLPAPFSDAGYLGMLDPLWGPAGLAVLSVHGAQSGLVSEALLYDPDGNQLVSYQQPDPVSTILWIADGGKDYVSLQQANGQWVLIDPLTKQAATIGSVSLEFRNLKAGASAHSVVYRFRDINSGEWSISAGSGRETPLNLTIPMWAISRLALDPTAQVVAYTTDAIYLWQGGTLTAIPGTQGMDDKAAWPDDGALAWSAAGWMLRPLGAG